MLSADGLQNCPGACVQRRCVVRVALAAVLPVWWLTKPYFLEFGYASLSL